MHLLGPSMGRLGDLVERVAKSPQPMGLIIESASRLVSDVNQLSDEEFAFYRRVDRVARRSQPCQGERPLFSPIIWVLDNERDVPNWFSFKQLLRSIVLPLPHTGEQQQFADRLVQRLVRRSAGVDEPQVASAVRILTEQTAGMTLVAMEHTIAIAEDQALPPGEWDTARAHTGLVSQTTRGERNLRPIASVLSGLPWRRPLQKAPQGNRHSRRRVLGQEVAVRKALDILVRSATGLGSTGVGNGDETPWSPLLRRPHRCRKDGVGESPNQAAL